MSARQFGIAEATIDGVTVTVLVEGPPVLRAKIERITERVQQAIDTALWDHQHIPACLRSAANG